MGRCSVAMVTVCLQVMMPEVSVHPGGILRLALNLQLEETLHLTEEAPSLWQVRSTGTCTQTFQSGVPVTTSNLIHKNVLVINGTR